MRKRSSDRRKWRLPCELRAAGSRYAGLVLDVSGSGLFIQTGAMTQPGQRLEVSLSLPNGAEAELVVRVARKRVVPAQLLTIAQGGVGVQILQASEAYRSYLLELGLEFSPLAWGHAGEEASAAAGGPEAGSAGVQRFRVRISQVSGPRSRRMELEAADAEAASAAALEAAGEGWKVLDVEPL